MTISIQDMTTADMPIHMKMDVPAMNAGKIGRAHV